MDTQGYLSQNSGTSMWIVYRLANSTRPHFNGHYIRSFFGERIWTTQHDAAYDAGCHRARCFFGLINQAARRYESSNYVKVLELQWGNLTRHRNWRGGHLRKRKDTQKSLGMSCKIRPEIGRQKRDLFLRPGTDMPLSTLLCHCGTQSSFLGTSMPSHIQEDPFRNGSSEAKAIGNACHAPWLIMVIWWVLFSNFVKEAMAKEIKAILGLPSVNLCRDEKKQEHKRDGYQDLSYLQKIKAGLSQPCQTSLLTPILKGFITFPRIDKELFTPNNKATLIRYPREDFGERSRFVILNVGGNPAEEAFLLV